MAKLNNVEIHFKHSNRTYNTMTAFLVMDSLNTNSAWTPRETPQYYIYWLLILTWMYSNRAEFNDLILQGFIPILLMGIN